MIKNRGPGLYHYLCHADNRKYISGFSLLWKPREAHMFYLEREVEKLCRCSCWEGNLIMINEFKYGKTWKIWPSTLSLSLYSTFKGSIRVFFHATVTVFREVSMLFGRPVYQFGCPKSGAKIILCKFCFFQLYFNKKNCEVAINDFTMHIITSKRLTVQDKNRKSKIVRQKDVEAKEEIAYKSVFIYLKHNRS